MKEIITEFLRELDAYNQTHTEPIKYVTNTPMSHFTTFKIGGEAAVLAMPQSAEAMAALVRIIKESGVRYYVVGNGSNLLFSDSGFEGVIISLDGMTKHSVENTKVTAEAGANLLAVCKNARDHALSGLEFAYGIPGSVGGAVFMNAGAYGGEIKDCLLSSTYLDIDTLEIHTITNTEHNFGYRDSIYRHTNRIILSATFELSPGNKDEITAQMNDVMGRRIAKQPLEFPSAGSVFKRPEGYFAGKLIEDSGLKGYRVGGAQVSEKHAGFIINRGGATEADVTRLIEHIQNTVKDNFGVELECEIIRVK